MKIIRNNQKLFCCLLLALALCACNGGKVAETPTPSATLTPAPPTQTPTPTFTPTVTPTPTATFTPTATPEISSEEALIMQEIEGQVAAIRGLVLAEDYTVDAWSQSEFDRYVGRKTRLEYPQEEQVRYEVTFGYLGLLDPTSPLQFNAQMFNVASLALYEENENEMILRHDPDFNALGRFTYAHELVYAMLDEMVDIDGQLGVNDANCDQHPDRCLALRALLEGDAAFTCGLWMAAHTTAEEQAEIVAQSEDIAMDPVMEALPLAFQEDLAFPAKMGTAFVSYLWEQGGWEAINQAYQDPPQSTEHIMHPERYPADLPLEVILPDLLPVLGEGWELFDQNMLGEWNLYLMLTSGVDPAARQAPEDALAAVEGWGGDTYQVFYHDETSQLLWISVVRWDTRADAIEFYNLLNEHETARFNLDDSEGDLIEMFQYLGLGYARMWHELDTTYLLLSSEADISRTALEALLED